MGTTASAFYRDTPVVFPSSHYVPTINKRFVKDRVVTLALHNDFWTQAHDHDVLIRDLQTNQTLFKLGPVSEAEATEPHRRRLLLDAYGVPIVSMERHDQPPSSAQYTVIPGNAGSSTVLCTVNTHMIGMLEPPFQLKYTDPVSGKPMILSAQGHWQSLDAVITLTVAPKRNAARDAANNLGIIDDAPFAFATDRLRPGVHCVARIYCDGNPLDGAFNMDVAAGADVSLVLLLAAMMEEQTKKHTKSSDRKHLRFVAKQAEKRVSMLPRKAKRDKNTF